ncbi:peptidase U32 family protein [Mycoplasma sp. P36-A1]|uniref:peptidase U32 family protein n=1 Tax=Mycoplasma sp. P36-A1 TaxID=3252900 RepID=UPI003C2E3556
MKKPELLAPAGNLEKLKIAILYGANAVYIGGKEFSLRSNASNFDIDDIKEGVIFAHANNARVYVVVNIIFHNDNLEGLAEYLIKLEEIEVDGIICADPYVIDVAKQNTTNIEIHISTQQSIANTYAIEFYEKLGANRVVLAREIDKEDLLDIMHETDVEIEYFVHGAMCVAYSGRCMLSNYYSRRDSNRGGCSQSCRWNYNLYLDDEEKTSLTKEGVPFTMSSKDLNLSYSIPELMEMGVDSLKIEGRMKSIYYLATIVSTYRKLIDDYADKKYNVENYDSYLEALNSAANREVSTGFYEGAIDSSKQLYANREEHPTKEFIGYVLDYDEKTKLVKVEQRNYFEINDKVILFGPDKQNIKFKITKMYDEQMQPLDIARHPQQIIYIELEQKVAKHSMIRKVK